MKKIIFVLILSMLALQIISADFITPGREPVPVNNFITNLDDYHDYIFVTAGIDGPGLGMCPPKIIGSDGKLSSFYYKFCSISVYAIEKNEFNDDLIKSLSEEPKAKNYTKAIEQFNSIEKKEVLKNINVYSAPHTSSGIKEINNYYTIDLNQINEKPKREIKRNFIPYLFILIPLIALIIIISILIRREKK